MLWLVILFCVLQFTACKIGCIDNNGNPVDWFIILKAPDGATFAYLDSNNSTFMIASNPLNTSGNSLAYTLAPIFSELGGPNIAYILYDGYILLFLSKFADQTPDNVEHENWGHTKGVIALDATSGFWLVHSVPRFPDTSIPYVYPHEETEFGQSFLCMTFPKSEFNSITGQFLVTKPWVYESNGPNSIINDIQNFQQVLNENWITNPANQSVSITTNGGNHFTAFAKNSEWNNYLYEGFVEPYYNDGMLIESWMNGPDKDKMPTFCKGEKYNYDSINIREVELPSLPSFKETKDHSKWSISISSSNSVVCIGDINRQFSQSNRGGGTVCMENANVWEQFQSLIVTADKCKSS